MSIVVFGANNKTAPIAVREQLAIAPSELPAAVARLRAHPAVKECVIVSTCNRVEAYAVVDDTAGDVCRFLLQYRNLPDEYEKYMYRHENQDALRHLCLVASGLDSLVLGEPQIFGQVKEAFNRAVKCQAAGTVFKSFFPLAFGMVKKVRARTGIGNANVSVGYIAVNLARQILSGLEGRNALMLGAGDMAQTTVRNLVANGVRHVYVANRTFERAVQLAEEVDGIPVMFHEVSEYLAKVDILISSLTAAGYVLNADQLASASSGRSLLIIDISVPRSVDPAACSLPNVHLYNVDDLEEAARQNAAAREGEADKARRMIETHLGSLMKRLDTQDLGSAIAWLRETAEQVRRESYDRFVQGGNVSEAERMRVDALTRSLVNRVLHHAITKLREHASGAQYGK